MYLFLITNMFSFLNSVILKYLGTYILLLYISYETVFVKTQSQYRLPNQNKTLQLLLMRLRDSSKSVVLVIFLASTQKSFRAFKCKKFSCHPSNSLYSMNVCINTDNFLLTLKKSKFLFIKKGDADGLNNYRPIVMIPIFSKIFEISEHF